MYIWSRVRLHVQWLTAPIHSVICYHFSSLWIITLKGENHNYFQKSKHKINFALICYPYFCRILPNYLFVFTKSGARQNVARTNYLNSQFPQKSRKNEKYFIFTLKKFALNIVRLQLDFNTTFRVLWHLFTSHCSYYFTPFTTGFYQAEFLISTLAYKNYWNLTII